MSTRLQGNLIMLLAMVIFGLNIPATKYLYTSGLATPVQVTALRMMFAAIAFWITSLFLTREKVAKKDLLILMVGGISGTVLNQGLFAYGLQMTSPVDASIITTSGPLFALVIAFIILKEPITWMKFVGVIIGGAGAVFLILSSSHANVENGANIVGNLCIVGAQIFYALYLVITRPLATKYSPITINKWVFLFASLAFLPISATEITKTPLFYQEDIIPFLLIGFVLVGATYFTFMMIPMAQKRIRPTTISMYNNVQPIVVSIVAIYMGMDRFSVKKLLACAIIFFGVYLVTKSKSKSDIEEVNTVTENK